MPRGAPFLYNCLSEHQRFPAVFRQERNNAGKTEISAGRVDQKNGIVGPGRIINPPCKNSIPPCKLLDRPRIETPFYGMRFNRLHLDVFS
jgi:hypothetical protein